MKHIKNFKTFLNESKQSFPDIQKEKKELDKLGSYEIFVDKPEQISKFLKECDPDMLKWTQEMSDTQVKVYLSPNNRDLMRSIGLLSFENGLLKVDLNKASLLESINWMSMEIPAESEWEITDGKFKDSKIYKIKKFDNSYIIPSDRVKWFKEHIGTTIRFKYDPSEMLMTNISINKRA
jgi:hypothetical protein